MKTHILISLAVLAFIVAAPRAQALFDHVRVEKERRQDAEQRVFQAQQANAHLVYGNERLHVTVSILSVGVVTALIVGAAVGSKARRNNQQP